MTAEWVGTKLKPRASLAEQVQADLRVAIRAGAFGTGGQLPSEPALSKQLGVSRPTIRQALSLLEQEGLVARRQGMGTFVQSTVAALPNLLNVNTGIRDMICSAGRHADTQETTVQHAFADERIAKMLQLRTGAAVAVIERIRAADGRVIALTRDVISMSLLESRGVGSDQVEALVTGESSFYLSLAGLGLRVAYGIANVLPILATKQLSEKLAIKTNTPLLLLEQTDYDSSSAPLIFAEEYLVPGPLAIYVFRRGPG